MCHVKIWDIACRITRCLDHEITIVEDVPEESWGRSFLHEIDSCLWHFTIEESNLIIGNNTPIGYDKEIQLVIDPMNKYILEAHHAYANKCENNKYSWTAKAPIKYIPKHIPVSMMRKVNVSTSIIQCFRTTIKRSSFDSRVIPTHSRIFWFAFSLVGMCDSFESNIRIFCVHRLDSFVWFIQW